MRAIGWNFRYASPDARFRRHYNYTSPIYRQKSQAITENPLGYAAGADFSEKCNQGHCFKGNKRTPDHGDH
jgi:hypothetical protein